MDRQAALVKLRPLEGELRRRGVAALCLFGSSAPGEAGPDSDVDLFVDTVPGARMSLLDLIGVQQFLEGVLAARVDLTTRNSLHPLLRRDIEAQAVAVF